LKDFDHIVLWVDYFNKNLSRRKGRKVRRDWAVFDPTLTELLDAARETGYDPITEEINELARYPRRPFVKSAYITLTKSENQKKAAVANTIAQKILRNRNKRKYTQK
jgi:signal recognition particle subunit SRP19